MKININEEEVRHILKMHSKEREKTFLLKEDNNSDIEKNIFIRYALEKNGLIVCDPQSFTIRKVLYIVNNETQSHSLKTILALLNLTPLLSGYF